MQSSTIPQITPSGPDDMLDSQESPHLMKTSKRDNWRNIITSILAIIAAPLVAVFLTAFVFQSYEVDGPSMESTLQNHDRLIVLKLPRSWARITHHAYIPKRGDVVIFVKRGLTEFGSNKDKQLIKRVIGLPGERVVVNSGKVTIYNASNPDGFNPDINTEWSSSAYATQGNVDITVPEGEIFVCGDNRPESLDSRSQAIGTIPVRDIVGKLSIRILPLGKAKTF
ncbi:MAG TPA: signal peptidase I [Patescibacteria group bacterium]|nr:signal peptidase I [Patescibacteria group bacterium]